MALDLSAKALAENTEVVNSEVVNTEVEGGDVTKITSSKDLNKLGIAQITSMSKEEREVLGSAKGDIEMLYPIGLASKPSTHRVKGEEKETCSSLVGGVFKVHKDMEIPQVDIRKDEKTGVSVEDVQWVEVKAGQEVVLSRIEVMFLLLKPEFAGICAYNGVEDGLNLQVNTQSFIKGTSKMPTVILNKKQGTGAIKTEIVDIDIKNGEGKWEIDPKYADKFGALLQRRTPQRANGAKAKVPNATQVAMGLRALLGM